MTGRQMIGVGVRRVVLARGELDKLEGPRYAARRAELRREAGEAARAGLLVVKKEKKENRQPKGGMPSFERKEERKQTTQGRDGRTVHRHHTGILRRGECGASRHLPLGACLFLSLFAVCRRFSLQPSCHPAVFLLSSFSLPSLLPLSLRSPLPRSASPLLPVGPLLSRLFLPLGAVPLSSLRIVAPQVYPAPLFKEK